MRASPGDRVIVKGHHVGEADRDGLIDGIVEDVETLGYGYNDPQRGSYAGR